MMGEARCYHISGVNLVFVTIFFYKSLHKQACAACVCTACAACALMDGSIDKIFYFRTLTKQQSINTPTSIMQCSIITCTLVVFSLYTFSTSSEPRFAQVCPGLPSSAHVCPRLPRFAHVCVLSVNIVHFVIFTLPR